MHPLPHNAFTSAESKLERADFHIESLQRDFRAFAGQSGHVIHVHGDKNGPIYFEVEFPSALPRELSLILSDAIHNLRAALDHAMWELLAHDKGVQDRFSKFPTANNAINYENSCRITKTPIKETIELLLTFSVYPGGTGEILYWLTQLDNEEKHRVLVPAIRVASIKQIIFIDLKNKSRWSSEEVVLHPGADGRSYIKVDPGIGIDCNGRFEAKTELYFGDLIGLKRKPIIPTLLEFRAAVAKTITTIKCHVLARYPSFRPIDGGLAPSS